MTTPFYYFLVDLDQMIQILNGHDFAPTYIISKDKKDVVSNLTKLKKKCDEVILATDPDREGEAIAWHLASVLGLDVNTTKRLEFHESINTTQVYTNITKETMKKEYEEYFPRAKKK